MALINVPEIQNLDSATPESINSRIGTIVDEINGGLDSNNISTGGIAAGNLGSNSVTTGKIADAAVTTPKWTNQYKFRVTRQAAAASGNSSFAKIVFDTETFDTNGNFATGTYTIPVNGFYQFNSVLSFASASNDVVVSLYKNGSEYSRGTRMKGSSSVTSGGVSDLIQCVAGDTIEIWAFGANNSLDIATANNYFSGFLVTET